MRLLHFYVAGCLGVALMANATTAAAAQTAALFLDAQVNPETNHVGILEKSVGAAGYRIEFVGVATLTNSEALSPARYNLLVLPNGRRLPTGSLQPLQGFLKQGGDLLVLGAPLWETALFQANGRWMSRSEFDRALASQRAERSLFDFSTMELKKWGQASNRRRSGARATLESSEPGAALRVQMSEMDGWETLASPPLDKPFPADCNLTCFQARGGARPVPLMIEWVERDGSRWIATVDLTREWKSYALPPSAFHPWEPPRGRGGPGDCLKLTNAVRLTVGVAVSHGATPGPCEYWLAGVGASRSPFGEFEPPASMNLPHLEGLSPGYLFYPVSDATELVSRVTGKAISLSGIKPDALTALHPRPGGGGFDQDRPWRWQPLLAARGVGADYRGAVGVLVTGPSRGSVATFTPAEPEFYRQEGAQEILRDTAVRLNRGQFLLDGGAEHFTVFTNQSVRLGARVLNRSTAPSQALSVRVSIQPNEGGPTAFQFEAPVAAPPRQTAASETNWWPETWPSSGFRVQAQLLEKGQVIDEIVHELHVWKPSATPRFVEARDGHFWSGGEPWKAHGVNYMPSSGIAMNLDYFEHWVGRGAYDPEVIDRDLRRIKAMNLNAVSVFIYHRSLRALHLLDFLRRCRDLGLRVNLSLRPGTPLDFRWPEMKELIEHYRLAQNDTVFAYDLAWEPSHFDQNHQEKHYAKPWREWVAKRHTTIEKAKREWNVPAADWSREFRDSAELRVPPMRWLSQDGPWRGMVADYRLFLDEFLGAKYAEARRLVRSIDPNHPVSFRMQLAGDPTHLSAPLPYDFYGLSDAVDIWEPEAYGRIGDWSRVRDGHFTAAYARLCDPRKPVLWAEMGYTVWDMNRMAPSKDKLDFTARFYRDFYRMLTESGADGVFFWWYPGGFRLGENSDFGIINPDGTDREITRVIRANGPKFESAPPQKQPDYWLEVDRDKDARGLPGIYEAVRTNYWQAIGEGKTPGLKWAKRPGGGAK